MNAKHNNAHKQTRTVALVGAALTGLMVAASVPAPVRAQATATSAGAAQVYKTARETRVALLPVINLSGEKDERQRRDQATKGNEELRKLFGERGFQIIGEAEIQKALADAGVDLTDEEFHNRATLYKIGRAVGADLIAFVVITDVDQRRVRTPLTDSDELVAKVKTKTWLLDAANEKPLVSARRQESESRNNLFPSLDSGARRIRNTVAGCVRDTLRDFFRDYPVAKR